MVYDPKTTALVLIEYQNDFTSPNGKLHDAVKECMTRTNMLENSVDAVKQARAKGVFIAHVPILFSDSYSEIKGDFGVLANVKAAGAFKASGWGGAFVECLTPQEGDVIVKGKLGLCGFHSTNLDIMLRQRDIKTVAIAGFLSNCCVESTMRAAYEKGYDVVTLTDCCAATSVEEHEAAVKFTYPMFSKPMTHDEFLKQLAA